MNLVIYGAQGYALGIYSAIKEISPQREISFFMVTDMCNNASFLGGIPVREISTVSSEMSQEEKDNTEIIIGTPENVQDAIEETLKKHGFFCYCRMTSDRWAELMNAYHNRLGLFMPLRALPVGSKSILIQMYMAKSHKDTVLKQEVSLPEYIQPIQVGTANTDKRIASVLDNSGENISEKNVNYSELTGLYWIWKNRLCLADSEEDTGICYYGLSQYRRMLVLSNDDLLRLELNDVDVVLPFPLPYEPNINAHHERYLKEIDWDALMTALKEIQPEYAECFSTVLEQQYLYNYNVILAKKDILREYCEWLFPILERTESLSSPKGADRADRYIGYMAETLETLYFLKNSDRYNIVHTECRLLY